MEWVRLIIVFLCARFMWHEFFKINGNLKRIADKLEDKE